MNKCISALPAILVCFFLYSHTGFAQKPEEKNYGKISNMIATYERLNGIYKDTFKLKVPEPEEYETHETTILGIITLPNSVQVEYFGKTRKINQIRKEAVNKWWKNFGGFTEAAVFFVNEIKVREGNKTYWLMADENNVVGKLERTAKKGDTVVLKARILGYHRKGKKFDYFLMAQRAEKQAGN